MKTMKINFRPLAGITITPNIEAAPYCTGAPHLGFVLYSRGGGGCWNQRTEIEYPPSAGMKPVQIDGAWFWSA
jgi:hypothetical protein